MTQTDARPLAVVTGASSGIGLELAKQFAKNGFDLLVVAEDEAINGAATELESYGVAVQGSQIDLATYDGVEHLYTLVSAAGRPVDAIALNAGVGAGGGFVGGTELQDELQVIDLNVKSIVHQPSACCRTWSAGARVECCSPRRSRRRCQARTTPCTTRRSHSFSRSPKRFATSSMTPASR